MKKHILTLTALLCALCVQANKPDYGYLFSYVNGRGIAFAYSSDSLHWTSIGNGRTFVDSDFGTWGAQKKMFTPHLMRDSQGMWRCVWSPKADNPQFAYCESPDLINWKPQDYPYVEGGSCVAPMIAHNGTAWVVTYTTLDNKAYSLTSPDCRTWSKAAPANGVVARIADVMTGIVLDDRPVEGQVHRVEWEQIDRLIKRDDYLRNRQVKLDEHMGQDPVRFADLKPVNARLTIHGKERKAISNELIGIFFEDISYGADGGLYGELIQNRDFEYSAADRGGWHSLTAWELKGEGSTVAIGTERPIHANNCHYATLSTSAIGATLENGGYDGIALKAGDLYDLSLMARKASGKSSKLLISLVGEEGETLASKSITVGSAEWKTLKATFKATKDAPKARLVIAPQTTGVVDIDMVSLFPRNTFKNRKNGLRADLAQVIADMKPKFVRFPGGCAAHGDGLDNMYLWKRSIGKLEERQHMPNIWNYHQTLGLGYYEYFLFCEDIGAEPLPVIPAAVPCQNSSHGGHGQQGGVPMDEMDAFIQDILDLIEWANGDAKTTKWGRVRAEAGHPKPFNLKYIGIGNEDLISNTFTERFNMIYDAVRAKHPEIIICGTVGPFYEGSDYEWGWKLAKEKEIPMVDEHYYVSPGWYIHNQDYYDHYDRNASEVYLGEYACHIAGRHNNIETALCEALHLTNVERNADIVRMTSYAPLLARHGHTNWNPDMIYFNSSRIDLTPGYYTQKIFGNNSGDQYITGKLSVESRRDDVRKRISTSTVYDSATGDLIIKFVNLLPVTVTTAVEVTDCDALSTTATCTVLTGKPADRTAVPTESTIEVAPQFSYEMPAYSFTTIRIAKEQQGKKK
ncbi:MAG: carbohydrate binding domain-containing protein [Bacteroidaceae bacterium]|nr:carbohydrate binding domain-containing protein [Bacteroidaceae bacterium]